MNKRNNTPTPYVMKTAWGIHTIDIYKQKNERNIVPYPFANEIGDFVFRIKAKNAFYTNFLLHVQ